MPDGSEQKVFSNGWEIVIVDENNIQFAAYNPKIKLENRPRNLNFGIVFGTIKL